MSSVPKALDVVAVVMVVAVAGCSSSSVAEQAAAPTQPTTSAAAPASRAVPSTTPPAPPARAPRSYPLRSITIALDPGHQLGNQHFPRQTNALVPAGGFSKPCNTTGAATDSGVAEATVNFRVARAVKRRLTRLGARVLMTRTTNSERQWGPCVDARGRFGKQVGARLTVSLHADGAPASARGFHVIAPAKRAPWTTDIADASLRLATALRDGLTSGGVPRSTYIGGGTALDVRGDLGTLNMSDVPVAMIEMGNLRNASDASRMTTRAGKARYARAVVGGIRAYLGR
jgi:N-acetylmuramoyl-L-alanine amidase